MTAPALETPPASPEPPVVPEAPSEAPKAPLVFVKEGTTTTAHDNEMARRFEDAERRRDEEALWAEAASKPIEQGGAVQYTHKLTRNPEVPMGYALLHYVNRRGELVQLQGGAPLQCCADIKAENPDNPNDLSLILCCPRCILRNKHWAECIVRLQQSNKRWELKIGDGPASFVFDDGFGPKVYHRLGTVLWSERFDCPACSFRARIDKDRIWPD